MVAQMDLPAENAHANRTTSVNGPNSTHASGRWFPDSVDELWD